MTTLAELYGIGAAPASSAPVLAKQESPQTGVIGFLHNLFSDASSTVTGLGALGSQAVHDFGRAVATTADPIVPGKGIALGIFNNVDPTGFHLPQIAGALPGTVVHDYAHRYGGLSNVVEGFYQHPLSYLLDVSAAGDVAGKGAEFVAATALEDPAAAGAKAIAQGTMDNLTEVGGMTTKAARPAGLKTGLESLATERPLTPLEQVAHDLLPTATARRIGDVIVPYAQKNNPLVNAITSPLKKITTQPIEDLAAKGDQLGQELANYGYDIASRTASGAAPPKGLIGNYDQVQRLLTGAADYKLTRIQRDFPADIALWRRGKSFLTKSSASGLAQREADLKQIVAGQKPFYDENPNYGSMMVGAPDGFHYDFQGTNVDAAKADVREAMQIEQRLRDMEGEYKAGAAPLTGGASDTWDAEYHSLADRLNTLRGSANTDIGTPQAVLAQHGLYQSTTGELGNLDGSPLIPQPTRMPWFTPDRIGTDMKPVPLLPPGTAPPVQVPALSEQTRQAATEIAPGLLGRADIAAEQVAKYISDLQNGTAVVPEGTNIPGELDAANRFLARQYEGVTRALDHANPATPPVDIVSRGMDSIDSLNSTRELQMLGQGDSLEHIMQRKYTAMQMMYGAVPKDFTMSGGLADWRTLDDSLRAAGQAPPTYFPYIDQSARQNFFEYLTNRVRIGGRTLASDPNMKFFSGSALEKNTYITDPIEALSRRAVRFNRFQQVNNMWNGIVASPFTREFNPATDELASNEVLAAPDGFRRYFAKASTAQDTVDHLTSAGAKEPDISGALQSFLFEDTKQLADRMGVAPPASPTDLAKVQEYLHGTAADPTSAFAGASPLPPRSAMTGSLVSDVGVGRVFRQTDENGFWRLLGRDPRMPAPEWFSNNPDLALSQGGKGVSVELDAKGLSGWVGQKPGWDFQYDHGNAEIALSHNSGDAYEQAIRAVDVNGEPSAQLQGWAARNGFQAFPTENGVRYVRGGPATGTLDALASGQAPSDVTAAWDRMGGMEGYNRATLPQETVGGPDGLAVASARPTVPPKVYAIPKTFARQMESYAHASGLFGNPFVRMFWDTPTNLWRSFVLQGSPRWVINNTLGNAVMMKLSGFGRIQDVVTLAEERWRQVIADKLGQNFHSDVLDLLNQVPGIDRAATGAFTGEASLYNIKRGSATDPAVENFFERLAGAVPSVAHKFGDFNMRLNSAVEDTARQAVYIDALQRQEVTAAAKPIARMFWSTKSRLENLVGRADQITEPQITGALREIGNTLGNFNELGPVERNVIRRFVFPFWGFYKHQAGMLARLPIESPIRGDVIRLLSEANDKVMGPYGQLPPWVQGAVPFGAPGQGEIPFYSSRGPNPFSASFQSIPSMLNPFAQIALSRGLGRNLYTGQKYEGSPYNYYTPFGSEQSYHYVRDSQGNVVSVDPMQGNVEPSLLEQILGTVPQYGAIKSALAGGQTYDTTTLAGILKARFDQTQGNNTPITYQSKPGTATNPLDQLLKISGLGTTPYNLTAYQQALLQGQLQALAAAPGA